MGVTVLRPQEPARFNPDKLEALCRQVGEVRAEAEVALALDRITAVLSRLPGQEAPHDPVDGARDLLALSLDAEMIGMATLARVARNVIDALQSGNPVTVAATFARLDRVGDRSIHAVWDLEDVSG